MNKVIIFSAPSGAGKSTVVNHLLNLYPQLEFSISATSRAPRGEEKHGKTKTKREKSDGFGYGSAGLSTSANGQARHPTRPAPHSRG